MPKRARASCKFRRTLALAALFAQKERKKKNRRRGGGRGRGVVDEKRRRPLTFRSLSEDKEKKRRENPPTLFLLPSTGKKNDALWCRPSPSCPLWPRLAPSVKRERRERARQLDLEKRRNLFSVTRLLPLVMPQAFSSPIASSSALRSLSTRQLFFPIGGNRARLITRAGAIAWLETEEKKEAKEEESKKRREPLRDEVLLRGSSRRRRLFLTLRERVKMKLP